MEQTSTLQSRARRMRSDMPQPERELWMQLRAKRLNGARFYRQFVIGPYIADFAARAAGLIVEVDGDTHTDAAYDARRTAFLQQQGYRVLRFSNLDVMTNMEGVLTVIAAALDAGPLPNPLPEGRGLQK